jgi:2-polyprenyl-3-methyl-5-hydroxy-6-metoxy-1,4-benzoquinol methylase
MNNCLACSRNVISSVKHNYFYGFQLGIRKILICPNCSLGFVDLLPSDETLKQYYSNDPTQDILNEFSQEQLEEVINPSEISPVLDFIFNHTILKKKDNKIFFDIGAGNGKLLKSMTDFTSWKTIKGCEPNVTKIKTLNYLNLDFYPESFDSCFPKLETDYDLVTLVQVLEHLKEPGITLEMISSMLSKDGLLYIEVPNCNENYYKTRMTDLSPHLTFWTDKSLSTFLTNNGFKVLHIGSWGPVIPKALILKMRLKRYFLYYLRKIIPTKINFSTIMEWAKKLKSTLKSKNTAINPCLRKPNNAVNYPLCKDDFSMQKLFCLASKN